MVITAKQEALIMDSWNEMKDDAPTFALKFFLRLFEIIPSATERFSFLRDSNLSLEKNRKLKAHAIYGGLRNATQLRRTGKVDVGANTSVEHLASVHFNAGIADVHFEVRRN
ncbi:non-symbiotic hemoglobin [Carex littledalei]|uniref:Non-symbiotic hemoglobin n=1 Tax=Carex littledalei TaxID=544730 RepID=A0A833QKD7_9POAL|nr:non-symbiotic hemoglobin [Carex littledalei]